MQFFFLGSCWRLLSYRLLLLLPQTKHTCKPCTPNAEWYHWYVIPLQVGSLQPIAEIAAIAHAGGALCHSDAAQSIGKVRCLSTLQCNPMRPVACIWLSMLQARSAVLTPRSRSARCGPCQ